MISDAEGLVGETSLKSVKAYYHDSLAGCSFADRKRCLYVSINQSRQMGWTHSILDELVAEMQTVANCITKVN